MFMYILPEFIILVAVWTQQFYEILLGVHEAREIDLENISEARDRFVSLMTFDLTSFLLAMAIQ